MDKKKVGQFHIHFSPQSVGKIRIQIKPVFFIKRDYTSGIFLVEDLNYLFSRLRTRIKKSAPFTVKKMSVYKSQDIYPSERIRKFKKSYKQIRSTREIFFSAF